MPDQFTIVWVNSENTARFLPGNNQVPAIAGGVDGGTGTKIYIGAVFFWAIGAVKFAA